MENKIEPGPYEPIRAFLGRMKYSLSELKEVKESLGRSEGARSVAIAITELEKLIAFTQVYLGEESIGKIVRKE